jgi:hypothetical protein
VADKPILTYGPAYIANSATNIYQGGGGSALIYDLISGIYLANTTASAVTVTIYLGLTGASTGGTELLKGVSIPANTTVPFYYSGRGLKLTSAQFLVGLAGTASAVTITITGTQAVV